MKKKKTPRKNSAKPSQPEGLTIPHQEAIDRQLLVDAGFATIIKTNKTGQPIDIQINLVGLLAAIIRTLQAKAVAPRGENE